MGQVSFPPPVLPKDPERRRKAVEASREYYAQRRHERPRDDGIHPAWLGVASIWGALLFGGD